MKKKLMIFCLISMVCIITVASQNGRRRTSNPKGGSAPISLTRSNEIPIPIKREKSKEELSVPAGSSEAFSPNIYYSSSHFCAWDNSPASNPASYR